MWNNDRPEMPFGNMMQQLNQNMRAAFGFGVIPPNAVALASKQADHLIDLADGGSETSCTEASRLSVNVKRETEKKSEVLARKMAAEPQNKRALRSNTKL
jgi:hypothetical protein